MEISKILDLENDGINMAVHEQFLYIRCKNTMYKYNLVDMSLAAHNEIFKKDGKSRGFTIYDDFVFLHDFLDLYILGKDDLELKEVFRLGENLSSDIGGVMAFDAPMAYVSIRNGRVDALDLNTKKATRFEISDSSNWCSCVAGKYIYAGTTKGELIEVDKENMRTTRKIQLSNKKNIYGVVFYNGMLYTVSLDKTIKVINADLFEVVHIIPRALKGSMTRILGIYNDVLVIAEWSEIALWDIKTLQPLKRFRFPTNDFNMGAILGGNTLFGSDHHGIYSTILNEL